jgi:pimeloyl-ACP methyl ester carboxylesterase
VALVHGAYHGAWCWRYVVPALEARGFAVVAPDLPCDDADAGLEEYAGVVEAALGDASDVVLVGHSLGGLTIPVVAARRPVRALAFLCSVPVPPGPTVVGVMPTLVSPAFLTADRFHDERDREMLSNQAARALFFDDVAEEEALQAVARLRPQARRPLVEPSPLEIWPDVATRVILTTDDRVVSLAAAREWLGSTEPLLLPGSHSPFLSRPRALADLLATVAGLPSGAARR